MQIFLAGMATILIVGFHMCGEGSWEWRAKMNPDTLLVYTLDTH